MVSARSYSCFDRSYLCRWLNKFNMRSRVAQTAKVAENKEMRGLRDLARHNADEGLKGVNQKSFLLVFAC